MRDGNDENGNGQNDAPPEVPVDLPSTSSGGVKERLSARFGGRPLMVYLVLFAGAAVLLLLLIIVWISASGGPGEGPPPCFDITSDEARDAVLNGSVQKVEIYLDNQRPEAGPSVIRLDLSDDTCRELPKGADNVSQAYMLVGVVEVYNNTHDNRIRVNYHRTDVLPEFLVTSTPAPTITSTPLDTPTATDTAIPSQIPASPTTTETSIPTSTSSPEPARTPGTPAATVSVEVKSGSPVGS
jgi:hypothetical protein